MVAVLVWLSSLKYMACWLDLTVWISVNSLCNYDAFKASKQLDLVLRTQSPPLKWPFKISALIFNLYASLSFREISSHLQVLCLEIEKQRVAVVWENTFVPCSLPAFSKSRRYGTTAVSAFLGFVCQLYWRLKLI